MPEIPPQDDPVVSRPMSVLILVSVFLLLLTVAWSLYGEFFGLRPWRDYQAQFRDLYSSYLRKQISQRRTQEQAFYASPDYKKLKAAVDAAGAAALPEDRKIQAQIDVLDRQRAAMTGTFQIARGQVGALTYQLEQIPESDKSGRASKLKELNEAKAVTYKVDWPNGDGSVAPRTFNYDLLNSTFTSLMAQKAALVAQRGVVDKPAKDAQAAVDDVREGKSARTGLRRSRGPAEQRAEHGPEAASDQREPAGHADQLCGRRGTGRPLPILPRGHRSAGSSGGDDADEGGPGCRQEPRCAFYQSSRSGPAQVPSHRKIRLFALPWRQRAGPRHRGEGARALRALAVAALLSGEC